MKKIYAILFATMMAVSLSAEVLLVESFDYPGDARIDTCGSWWMFYPDATSQMTMQYGALYFKNYAGSNIGNSLVFDTDGSNDQPHNSFPHEVTEGSVYVAFLLMPNYLSKEKGYFLCLRDDAVYHTTASENTYNFNGRVFLNNMGKVGLTFADNQKAEFSEDILDDVDPTLIVMKYTINAGNNNDEVSLYAIREMSKTEPATPLIGPLKDSNKTDINPKNLVLRAFDANGVFTVDGIRVATTWEEAVLWVEEETALSNTTSDTRVARKVIRDGQICILKNGKFYNALGVEL